MNDVHIAGNVIDSGGGSGIQLGANSSAINYNDYTVCDNWGKAHSSNFEDDPAVPLPRNIRIDTQNQFYGGAVSGAGRYVSIDHNSVLDIYWPEKDNLSFPIVYPYPASYPLSPYPDKGGGGVFEQERCGDQVKITYNTLTGNYVSSPGNWTSGMELYASNLDVENNTVTGFAAEAIGLLSAGSAIVSNNHLGGNSLRSPDNQEIKVATSFPAADTCHPNNLAPPRNNAVGCESMRDTQAITITGNDHPTGIGTTPIGIYLIRGYEGSTNNMSFNDISSNSMLDNISIAKGTRVNSNMTGTSQDDDGLQTISIFPEGTASINDPNGIQFGTPCKDPPACTHHRGFFRFGANVAGGPSFTIGPDYYVDSIEVYFATDTSQGTADNPGANGPNVAQPFCHFKYSARTSNLQLDYNTQGSPANFSGFSHIGTGQEITNSVCTIYPATSQDSTSGTDVLLYLDIQFNANGTYYMYELATDKFGGILQGLGGVKAGWSLWGYWQLSPQ